MRVLVLKHPLVEIRVPAPRDGIAQDPGERVVTGGRALGHVALAGQAVEAGT
ncbi:hypothetical protein [Streptomyces sp. CBMA152]|uniref:hypothetical protein n=1 Tax=Streptomyces sp. CBMA152 TaxID=1896312 RepID=UPI001660E52B|nr:hypothetical protein [Streptomyces sp. CBMA152]